MNFPAMRRTASGSMTSVMKQAVDQVCFWDFTQSLMTAGPGPDFAAIA
jgi:hypothetical protein